MKGEKEMNTLLIFFALPIAVIIISIALQKIFKCPFLVAGIIFAIFLIVTFVVGNLNLLIATIAYTILAFITAVLTNIICRILRELDRREGERESSCCNRRNRNSSNNNNETQLLSITGNCSNNDNGNLLTISSNGCNGVENDLLTINTGTSNNNNNGCSCNTSNDSIAVRANVFPNNNTNGRTGSFCGCFRRR